MTWNYLEDTFMLVLEGLLVTSLFAIFMYMFIIVMREVWHVGVEHVKRHGRDRR